MRTAILVLLIVLPAFASIGCKKGGDQPDAPALPEIPYSLQVSPFHTVKSGRYFVVQGLIPAHHPRPETPINAVLFCGAQWRYLGDDQHDQYKAFKMWVDTSAAELDRNSFTYQDIKVSCEADSTIRIASSSFDKTLAVLSPAAESEEALARVADKVHYFRFGAATGDARVAAGSGTLDAAAGGGGVIAARQGERKAAVLGAGKATPFSYDPAQPVELLVERPGVTATGPFDVLTINRNAGWLSWRKTATKPFSL